MRSPPPTHLVRISFPSNGARDSGFGESLRIANRCVLHTPIAVVHECLAERVSPRPERHLEGVEGKFGVQRVRDLPTHDGTGEHIGDERGVAEPAAAQLDVGDVLCRPSDYADVALDSAGRRGLLRFGRSA